MDGPPSRREDLIGPRFPTDPATALYYPDADFTPHPVAALRPGIWYNQRRLVNLTILNNDAASAILTLFIPFCEEAPPLLFETMHLSGTDGWVMRRAADIGAARANHRAVTRELCERSGLPFPVNYCDHPPGRR